MFQGKTTNHYITQSLTLFSKPRNNGVHYFLISNLGNKNKDEFLAEFKAIPSSTNHLDLETNDLHMHLDETIEAFSLLPRNTNSLNLSSNCLGDLEIEDKLPNLFAAIPDHVIILNLTGNYFAIKNEDQLEKAFQAIHKKVISIDLSLNDFNEYPIAKLIQLTNSLPPALQSLNLSANYLGEKSDEELNDFFSKLANHKQLKCLDLRDNFFSDEQIDRIKNSLAFVERIIFFDTDLHKGNAPIITIEQSFDACEKNSNMVLS
ncbi:leucine-rich repeat domain-containing protein [Legionella longbeachae]|uniref:hypothetical protein n=1 Tax=Legionella longbeachae TaxID=450 RepID=UPI001247DE53|nr:hypothetical protein [Legionella longbeachae]QEY51617.1 hypothetical protein FQU71_10395 [Legionella longbeachae]